jgi:hypothetical protein
MKDSRSDHQQCWQESAVIILVGVLQLQDGVTASSLGHMQLSWMALLVTGYLEYLARTLVNLRALGWTVMWWGPDLRRSISSSANHSHPVTQQG